MSPSLIGVSTNQKGACMVLLLHVGSWQEYYRAVQSQGHRGDDWAGQVTW